MWVARGAVNHRLLDFGAMAGCCGRGLAEASCAEQLGKRSLEMCRTGLEIVRIWHGRSTGLGRVVRGQCSWGGEFE